MKLSHYLFLSALLGQIACASDPSTEGAASATPVSLGDSAAAEGTVAPTASANANSVATAAAPVPSTRPTHSDKLVKADSTKVLEIMNHCKNVDQRLARNNMTSVKLNIYDPSRDIAGVVRVDGQVYRVTVSLFPKDREYRMYYYLKDGKLVMVKHREWFPQGNPPSAKEVIMYLEESGRPFFVQEHSVTLDPGQKPSTLMSAPFTESPMNRDSLGTEIAATWTKIAAAINK